VQCVTQLIIQTNLQREYYHNAIKTYGNTEILIRTFSKLALHGDESALRFDQLISGTHGLEGNQIRSGVDGEEINAFHVRKGTPLDHPTASHFAN
jgi:hypothetical protein